MIYSALLLGLASSLHCIGMCGPIAFVLPLDRERRSKKLVQLIAYHSGRLCSYALLGLFFGLLGRGLFVAGLQQNLSIVLGLLMIGMSMVPEKRWSAAISAPVLRLVSALRSAWGKRLSDKRSSSLFLLGTLNGLLPCGMVYAALFGAMAMQQTVSGILFMALFGLGTLPMMLGFSYYGQWLSAHARGKMKIVLPVLGVFVGLLFVLRGLGLGIPYISPADLSLVVKAWPGCH